MPFKPEENNVSLFETVYLSKGKKKDNKGGTEKLSL